MALRRADEDDEEEPLELVRADGPGAPEGPDALARLLAQSHRESSANRAQARELIRALEGVQRSQEYLGTALRDERARSRRLVLLAFLAPLAMGAAAWWLTHRVEDVRGDVETRLARMEAEGQAERERLLAGVKDARLSEIDGDLQRLRDDLAASREALASERQRVTEREQALAAAEGKTDSARMEIGGLEYELRSAKSRAAAERARAEHLETRIKELEAQAAERAKAKPAAPAAAAPDTGAAATAPPSATPAAPSAAKPSAASSAEVETTRALLNTLLSESKDAVRYEFSLVGGMEGRTLRDVHVVGTDAEGRVVRTIRAARAEVTADRRSGSVVLRFFQGKLSVGSVEAPFYDDTYGLVVRGDAQRWSASGLACLQP